MIAEGTTLDGRYRLGPLLGAGGMADVHLADDERTGRSVALKVLRNTGTLDEARFRSEADVLRLLDHPDLVRLLDSGTWGDRPYLVMDFVDGLSLAERLEGGPLGAEGARELGQRLASGLAHAHGLGVVHRDVKPANILLDAEGRPRLADFGIARLVDTSGLTSTGMVMGTAAYLAPEQLQGHPVGPPADVYALGLVLIESHTGHRSFHGPATEAALARLTKAPEVPADLPRWWQDLLTAMTGLQPGQRPSAADVHGALAATDAPSHPGLLATEAVSIRGGDTSVLPHVPSAGSVTTPAPGAVPPREALRTTRAPAAAFVVAGLLILVVLGVLAARLGAFDGFSDADRAPAGVDDLPPELRDSLGRLRDAVRS